MKKITLLAVAFLFAIAMQAQTTSFEQSEGYELGEINGQNGWQSDDSEAYFATISDEQASDGDWSLKVDVDDQGVIPADGIAGPILQLDEPVTDFSNYSFSADIYIPEAGFVGESDILGFDSTGGNVAFRIAFFGGNLNVIEIQNGNLALVAQAPTNAGEFNHFELSYNEDGTQIEYLLNEASIYTGSSWGTDDLAAITVWTSGDDTFYADNLVGTYKLGVEDFQTSEFTHYNKNNQLYLDSQSQIGEVAIYNLLGQQVVTQNMNATSGSIDLSNLSSGIYMAKVAVNGQSKSFKFVK